MTIVQMLVVWIGVDFLEMMLLYFKKHIKKMNFFPLQNPACQQIAVLFQQARKSLEDTQVTRYAGLKKFGPGKGSPDIITPKRAKRAHLLSEKSA